MRIEPGRRVAYLWFDTSHGAWGSFDVEAPRVRSEVIVIGSCISYNSADGSVYTNVSWASALENVIERSWSAFTLAKVIKSAPGIPFFSWQAVLLSRWADIEVATSVISAPFKRLRRSVSFNLLKISKKYYKVNLGFLQKSQSEFGYHWSRLDRGVHKLPNHKQLLPMRESWSFSTPILKKKPRDRVTLVIALGVFNKPRKS